MKLTEFSAWADLLYVMKSANIVYSTLAELQLSSDVDTRQIHRALHSLKEQRPLDRYEKPQAVLEKIRPEWLVSYKKLLKG